jgi:hypothetical protein
MVKNEFGLLDYRFMHGEKCTGITLIVDGKRKIIGSYLPEYLHKMMVFMNKKEKIPDSVYLEEYDWSEEVKLKKEELDELENNLDQYSQILSKEGFEEPKFELTGEKITFNQIREDIQKLRETIKK